MVYSIKNAYWMISNVMLFDVPQTKPQTLSLFNRILNVINGNEYEKNIKDYTLKCHMHKKFQLRT